MAKTIFHLGAMALAISIGSVRAVAPLIPVEEFSRGPEVAAVQLSPSGEQVAMLKTVEGRSAIVLADTAGENDRVRYRDAERSIGNVAWSATGKWLYFFQDKGGDEGFHLFALDPRTDEPPKDLTPFKGVAAEAIRSTPTSDHVLIALNQRNPAYPDAYRVEIATGKLTELVRNPDRFIEFFAGSDGQIVAASAIETDGALTLHRRAGATRWEEIYRAPPSERMKVLAAHPRPGQLIIRSNRNAEQETLLSLDLESGRTAPLVRHPCSRFDAEDVVVDAGRLLGGSCFEEAATLWSKDPAFSQALAAARKSVGPGAGLWWESASRDLSAIAFFTNKGDDPGRFLMWRHGRGIQQLAATRPWLNPDHLTPTRARWMKARDGLPLLAYITRPKSARRAGPAVIAVHGGPWSRDLGGFESETQLLANRGYTVVQVNFRGSTGLGKKVFDAGVGEFGRKMSDDIDDVARALIKEGTIDPKRICLLGGSYGGYATLVGLARDTVAFRCGVDYAGPADLATLIGAFPPSWKPYLPRSWYRFVGNPGVPDQKRDMDERSPVNLASRISAPLLIFQGLNDPRVRKEQSDAIVCSLRSRGIEVDYLLATNEGHSFANEETRLAVNLSVETFLARHLGGRAQEDAKPATRAAREQLLANGRSQLVCPGRAFRPGHQNPVSSRISPNTRTVASANR